MFPDGEKEEITNVPSRISTVPGNAVKSALYGMCDKKYAEFQSRLIPGVPPEKIIGIKIPQLRKYARSLTEKERTDFISALPHEYYDENILHGIILSRIKDFDECIGRVEEFLPYIDNWAVCDTLRPACFAKNTSLLMPYIDKWLASSHTYTVRFGTGILMCYFLDEHFSPEYLRKAADIHSDEYYVNMMTAWYFATALAKQYDSAVIWLEQQKLSHTVHSMTIRKACESLRITDEQKKYLRSLKRTKSADVPAAAE